MRTNFNRRLLSFLLMLCMLFSLLPLPVIAQEATESAQEAEVSSEQSGTQITYSDLSVSFDQMDSLLSELSGKHTVTLRRGGNVSQALTVTVLVYDNSANYGEDYRIFYGGELIEKIDGARSIYDAFRDEGELNEGWVLSSEASEAADDADGSVESVDAAQMLAQLDELNVLAARIPVTFAAGEATAEITVEILDDAQSEYEETFLLAVLDPDGEVFADGQLLLGIEDNEEAPTVTVLFDCEEELVADPDTGLATLVFSRVGDLATSTEALLYMDDEPLGYVDFTPYQDTQIVYAEPGVYRLAAGAGYSVTSATVTVLNTDGSASVPEGADPDLDAVPDAYASMESPATRDKELPSTTSWIPSWMNTSGTTEYSSYITYVGTPSSNLYSHVKVDGVGHFWKLIEGTNINDADTSGTWSGCKTGYVNVRTSSNYDMTGIASVELPTRVEGLRHNNRIWFSACVANSSKEVVTSQHYNSSNNVNITMSVTLPDKYQGSCRFYLVNQDPTGTDDGCHVYFPNGLKLNKRQYRILIEPSDEIEFRGVKDKKKVTIQKDSDEFFLYMSDSSSVKIAWNDIGLPVKLVGYQLVSASGQRSATIPLNDSSFVFNKAFLKAYESTYAYNTKADNGNTYSTFKVVPVFEKVKTTVVLEDSSYGSIYIKNYNGEQLYMGESITLGGRANGGTAFYGVYYKCYSGNSSSISLSGTQDMDSEGYVTYSIGNYEKVVLQGAFNVDADRLMVNYATQNAANRHGKLSFSPGIVLDSNKYVKNDYFPLMAEPDEGYVTQWYSNGRYFYGDVFYHQLDGNPNNNWITVEFVSKSSLNIKTANVSGTLSVYDMELRSSISTTVQLAQKEYSVYAGETYTGKTDDYGKYTIENFTGVVGGTYSIAVLRDNAISYATFVPFGAKESETQTDVTFSQFPYGSIYPSSISISLGYLTGNYVQIRTKDSGSITVRVTNEPGGSVLGVDLHFLSVASETFGDEMATLEMTYNKELSESGSGLYSYWTLEIDDMSIFPARSRMYVSVSASKTYTATQPKYDSKGNYVGTEVVSYLGAADSGYVNSGYEFINAIEDNAEILEQSVPDLPGAQNAYSTNAADLVVPVLGSADFSMTSLTGGYFVQKTINGTTYLICGYSITPVYGRGTLQSKFDGAKKTATALIDAQEQDTMSGSANVQTNVLGESTGKTAGQTGAQTQKKKPSDVSIYPAFMFKFALTTGLDEEGKETAYLTGFEMALGFDVYYLKNIPYTIYGFPFYLCVTTQVEAYALLQHTLSPNTEPGSDTTLSLYEMCQDPDAVDEATVTDSGFFCAPTLSVGLKAGAGFNGFLSAYVSGTVQLPMSFQFRPSLDVGGQFSFNISFGADLIFFTANYTPLAFSAQFGSSELAEELSTIQGYSSSFKGVQTQAEESTLTSTDEIPSLEEMMDSLTFSLMDRPESGTNLHRSVSVDNATLAENVFKNTKIRLVQLGNGNIMALFLEDNGEEGYNYLSASYAISKDGGNTWSDINYVSNNIGQANTSLQFDISIFELEDRILITWSEADFDTLLADIDADNLTVGQIAKLMNHMNLHGRFFDIETGEAMGDAFRIAESSTVACGALDAVQDGENVYVYYQRNVFPTEEETTLTDLINTERTIAMARANVNDAQNWTSTSVRALNENGQQYRITEVVPFVHDGVMGEVLVIDRNGKLAVLDAETGEWTADNEDRQLFLRTYTFDEDGTPQPTALIALTDAKVCAQSPQVVSNENYLHLFWNENGEIVYLTDFIASEQDNEDVRKGTLLLRQADGTVTVVEHDEIGGSQVTGTSALEIGTTFTASMADDGNVLLCWIANDTTENALVPEDRIYGLILNTVTNAEAAERSGSGAEGGNENVYQLWAVGSPIALTDESGIIGALDSLCLESGAENKFLLAYTALNSDDRVTATSADIKAVQSTDAPEPVIEEVDAPTYPAVGSEMEVTVTVTNYGLEALNGVRLTASGIGQTVTQDFDETILPGESAGLILTVSVPSDFNRTADLTVTAGGLGDQAAYGDTAAVKVCYEAYFVIDEMSTLVSLPNSTDCEATTYLRNIGNAAGSPTLTFVNTIFGSDEYYLEYVFESDETVEPNGEVYLVNLLEDTLMNKEKTANLSVFVGDGYDQSADSLMPVPVLATPQAESTGNRFTDVSDHWAQDAIEAVCADGLMNGMSATTFEPDTAMTRAMLVTVLYRMSGEPEVTGTVPFADVSDGMWYTDAIVWAAENGIVKGIGKGLFDPDGGVTREQMATILYRYAEFVGLDVSARTTLAAFPDAAQCSSYAIMHLSWAVGTDLIRGTRKVDKVYLDPQGYATRAQAATVIQRFRETYAEFFAS